MKRLWIILLASLGLSVFFYISNGQALTVRYHVEKELVNEEQIISEIEIPLAHLVTGIVERDAPLIFSIFSDPVNSRYVREGAIYDSINSAETTYAKWFEERSYIFPEGHE